MSEIDDQYMTRALDLARMGKGLTSPNPMVVAILVKGGRVVGEGFYRYEERKHAEVLAIEQAGNQARRATLYVTLEPCSHYGRTPPCANQVIEAGVIRVVAAMVDPNPLVKGSGLDKLKEAGISVSAGIREEEAQKINEAYTKYIRTHLPFVTLKTAMTLDGKIAEASGHSKWISDEPSRARVQQLRFENDAMLVGIGTVLKDDPILTNRTQQLRRRPLLRVVLDTHLKLPPKSRLVESLPHGGGIIAFCCEPYDTSRRRKLEELGVEVIALPSREGRISFELVLRELGKREITGLLIEGGSEVNFEALRSGSVDRVLCFVAPKILGGHSSIPFVGGEGFGTLENSFGLSFSSVERVGSDLLIEAYVSRVSRSANEN